MSNYRDDEFSLSNPITSVGNIFYAKSFDYFADAFPYKYKTQHYQQRKFWYRNASHGRHADRCRQNPSKTTGWSHSTVSMATYCLPYNKLTPDESLANHVLRQWPLRQFLTPGLRQLFSEFATPHHSEPLVTNLVETLPVTNVTHKLYGFRTTAHATAPLSDNT